MMHVDTARRTSVIVLDNLGYDNYRGRDGRPYFPADQYDVRLVTDLALVGKAHGPEVDSVLGVQLGDEQSVAEAVEFMCHAGGETATKLVAVSEALLLPAARLRERLGLPGQSLRQALRFRDKVTMKQCLADRGLRVPDFAPFSSDAAHRLLRTHGTVVAKPRLGAGSIGVAVLRSGQDISAFVAANKSWLDEFEVEEFIEGDQYHIDSVVDRGRCVAATAGRSLDPTTAYRDLAPYRDVATRPGALNDALLSFNREVIACFPEFSGVTHHEVFVQKDEVVFCEIAARAGGGGVVTGFRSRTGVDLHQVAVTEQLTGTVPAELTVAPHLTGYVLIYADTGTLTGPVPPLRAPWVVEFKTLGAPGVHRPRAQHWGDAAVMVSVLGETEEEVAARLEQAVRDTEVEIKP